MFANEQTNATENTISLLETTNSLHVNYQVHLNQL